MSGHGDGHLGPNGTVGWYFRRYQCHFSFFSNTIIFFRLVSKFLPTSKRKKQEKIGPGKDMDKLWQGPELVTNELANDRCSELGADSKKYG